MIKRLRRYILNALPNKQSESENHSFKLAERAIVQLSRYSEFYGMDNEDEEVISSYLETCKKFELEPNSEITRILGLSKAKQQDHSKEMKVRIEFVSRITKKKNDPIVSNDITEIVSDKWDLIEIKSSKKVPGGLIDSISGKVEFHTTSIICATFNKDISEDSDIEKAIVEHLDAFPPVHEDAEIVGDLKVEAEWDGNLGISFVIKRTLGQNS